MNVSKQYLVQFLVLTSIFLSLSLIALPSMPENSYSNSFTKNLVPSSYRTSSLQSMAMVQAPPLLVNIIWHQHQPMYKDPLSGEYLLPWVFLHGTKDYQFMVDIIPSNINVTIDLTGSLIQQLQDYANYTTSGSDIADLRIQLANMTEDQMSQENKTYVWNYFFDLNPQFITLSGRYTELQQKKNSAPSLETGLASFTDQDWLDLKSLFFFYWLNFDYITTDSTLSTFKDHYVGATSSATYHPFSHTNLSYILNYGLNVVKSVLPQHKQAQDAGNVEIITSPLNHPILPLLINLTSARDTKPGNALLPLPANNTLWTEDALAQLVRGSELYKQLFNQSLVGLWPSEEAVSPAIIPLVNQTGIAWLVTDQQQLQKIVPALMDYTGTVEQEDLLYRPYRITDADTGTSVVTVYRNTQFSDAIGFQYSGMDPILAANDFVNGKLKNIYNDFNTTTNTTIKNAVHLVTIALDGENAWEYYTYNGQFTGNTFLKALYAALQSAQDEGWMQTITMTQYLHTYGTTGMSEVVVQRNQWVGSWVDGQLNRWIGYPEKVQAWERLEDARTAIMLMNLTSPNSLAVNASYTILLQAEGSDWFWWYGPDQNSGHDELFDWLFKSLLRGIYTKLGYTDNTILTYYPYLFIKEKPPLTLSVHGYTNPTLDGIAGTAEWDQAACYNNTAKGTLIKTIYAGYQQDSELLYVRIDPGAGMNLRTATNVFYGIYFDQPGVSQINVYTRYESPVISTQMLGMELVHEIGINFTGSTPTSYTFSVANGASGWVLNKTFTSIGINTIIELAIPFSDLGVKQGDSLAFSVVAATGNTTVPLTETDHAPWEGPWMMTVPSGTITGTTVFTMADPAGDDALINPFNDGTMSDLVYPSDKIFSPGYGWFDLLKYLVATDASGAQAIFQTTFADLKVDLSWNTPTFTLEEIQIYIQSGNLNSGTPRTDTINNANVRIDPAHPWDLMLNLDGELANQYVLFANGTKVPITVTGDVIAKTVTATVPYTLIGVPTQNWNYSVLIGSKDFDHFRKIGQTQAQWVGGGGNDNAYSPNIYDMLVSPVLNQKLLLTNWSGTFENPYLALVPMIGPFLLPSLDLIPPTISIISHTTGTVLDAKGQSQILVTITFHAVDNVGVTNIECFINQYLVLHSTNSGLGTLVLTWYRNGNYTLRINVFDAAGNYGTANVFISISGIKEDPVDQFFVVGTIQSIPGAAPGYTALEVLALLTLFAVISIITRRKYHG